VGLVQAAKLVVVQPARQVRVVIEPVGGSFHLVKVMAMLARRCFLLGSLAHDVQFFPVQFRDLGQRLFQAQLRPSPVPGFAS
jgi:hypothetical protein